MKLTKQQLKQVIKEELEKMRGAPSDRLVLNEVNLGSLIPGITREGGARAVAIRLTMKYLADLDKISTLEGSTLEFQKQLVDALQDLKQQGKLPQDEEEIKGRMRQAYANKETDPEEFEAATEAYRAWVKTAQAG